MSQPNTINFLDLFNTIQSATPDLGLVILAGLSLLLVGFSLLMYRQARQMNYVLPTPLSPLVQILVMGYTVLTIFTLGLIVASIM